MHFAHAEFERQKALIINAGGFVNKDLKLAFEPADIGNELSCDGVGGNEISLVIPASALISENDLFIKKLCLRLGRNWDIFKKQHISSEHFVPLMMLFNHDENGDLTDCANDNLIVRGSTICYTRRKNELERIYGIYG